MNIVELLHLRGLSETARTKLIRHQDKRFDLWELLRKGHFETYQSFQSKPVFDCDFIASFIGLENSKARLIGVYKVGARHAGMSQVLPPDLEPLRLSTTGHFYELERQAQYGDLEDRVVIEWGAGALAWHQWLSEKEVVEILPKGYVREFPGYVEFILSYEELRTILLHPDANREWHRALARVAGIYLITDSSDGRQYVGSAYGAGGILSRWRNYVDSGHGGNARLMELLGANPAHAHHFRFTILQTLPSTLTFHEIIKYEGIFKNKLGARAFGLNAN